MKEEFLKTEDAYNKALSKYREAIEAHDNSWKEYSKARDEWHKLMNKFLKLWVEYERLKRQLDIGLVANE